MGRRQPTRRLLPEEGVLADPEDVFFLTADEFLGRLPDDPGAVVAERRIRHKHYGTRESHGC